MDLFGGAKKTTKSKKTKKTTKTTKTSEAKKTKKSSTTTRSKSKTKGGNFLGAVGDLVAPTGWGPFATAAGLLALDRATASLRRGTKEKKMKGGGNCSEMNTKKLAEKMVSINRPRINMNNNELQKLAALKGNAANNPQYLLGDNDFLGYIICEGGHFVVSIEMYCGPNATPITYKPQERFNNFESFDEAKIWLKQRKNQLALINLALLNNHETCKNPDYKSAFNLRKS